jgi:hypothetical protein
VVLAVVVAFGLGVYAHARATHLVTPLPTCDHRGAGSSPASPTGVVAIPVVRVVCS